MRLVLLLFVACLQQAGGAKPRKGGKGRGILMADKKELQQLAGTRKDRRVTAAACGVVVQLVHPIQSEKIDVQKRITEDNSALSKSLGHIAKSLGKKGADLVAIRKMTYQQNRLFFSASTTGIEDEDYANVKVRT